MKVTIKNFDKTDDSVVVGLTFIDERGQKFSIDQTIDATGKTDEECISEAHASSLPEMEEWRSTTQYKGKQFNPDTGQFV